MKSWLVILVTLVIPSCKAFCGGSDDVTAWQTSGICLDSADDMEVCATKSIILPSEERPPNIAGCLGQDRGWDLTSACLLCFGNLVTCTSTKCVASCVAGGSDSFQCQNCVQSNCYNPSGTFDFSNCSRTTQVDPADLSECSRPTPNTIVPGLDDIAFFGIVAAAAIVLLVGAAVVGRYYLCKDNDVESLYDGEESKTIQYNPPGSSDPAGKFTKPSPPPFASTAPPLFGAAAYQPPAPSQIIVNGEIYNEEPLFPNQSRRKESIDMVDF